jgi:hypothetical protein
MEAQTDRLSFGAISSWKAAHLLEGRRQRFDTTGDAPSIRRRHAMPLRIPGGFLSPGRLARRLLVGCTMAVFPVSALTTGTTPTVSAPRENASAQFQSELRRAAESPTAVPARRTQLSPAEAQDAIQQAWTERFGEAPRPETLAILTAQWSHETAEGKAMYNFNFAGIKGVGPSGLHVTQRTREGYGNDERVIRDSFRAYGSAKEGALDYLSLLDRKYGGALDSARSGDVTGFVSGLHEGGYFTGDKRVYERSVSRHANRILVDGPSALRTGADPIERLEPELHAARQSPASTTPTSSAGAPGAESSERTASFPLDELQLQSFTDQLALAALRIASATDPRRG